MTTHSNILAWRIPWTIKSMGSQRIEHDWVTFTFTSLSGYNREDKRQAEIIKIYIYIIYININVKYKVLCAKKKQCNRRGKIGMPEFYLCPTISSVLEALRKQYIQETKMNGYIITLELAELGPNTLVQGSLIKLVWTMCLMPKTPTGWNMPSLNSTTSHQKWCGFRSLWEKRSKKDFQESLATAYQLHLLKKIGRKKRFWHKSISICKSKSIH